MTTTHLLAAYEAFVQDHQAQFTPVLQRLHTHMSETLHRLQQQEQPLVAAQTEQLAQLRTQLATDARLLLRSIELQSFVAQVQKTARLRRWDQTEPSPELDPNPAAWQLAHTDLAITISHYTPIVDHDAYDDERTHTTYGYTVRVCLGTQTQTLSVLTRRVYSPVERQTYSLRQLLAYDFEDAVAQLLQVQSTADAAQLTREISYLLCCGAGLLALTPQRVQFHYMSAEGTA